ncbi:MAG: hypothetical protein KIH62_001925 [Candidatus Kerfeldbacteria bacterium]|nr:hypothetical protein [Candidatus Kerfeldbacteria bacterium]
MPKLFLDDLPPRFAFWIGVAAGITFVAAVSCIILLLIVLRG